MTNIQELLDSLGTPPAEVCVEWAWQLHRYAACHGLSTSSEQSCWAQWTLSDFGQLVPVSADSDCPTPGNPTGLVAQLLRWAGVDLDSERYPMDAATHECLLNKVARRGSQKKRPAKTGVSRTGANVDEKPSFIQELLDNPELLSSLTKGTRRGVAKSNSRKPPIKFELSELRNKFSLNRFKGRTKTEWLNAATLPTLVVLMVLPSFFMSREDENAGASSVYGSQVVQRDERPTIPPAVEPNPKNVAQEQLLSVAELVEQQAAEPTNEPILNSDNDNVLAISPPATGAPVEDNPLARFGMSSSLASSSHDMSAPRPEAPTVVKSSAVGLAASAVVGVQENVESEVEEPVVQVIQRDIPRIFLELSRSEPTTSDIDVAADELGTAQTSTSDRAAIDGPLSLPVQLVAVDSMRQIMRLPPRVHARNPSWQLRLEVPDSMAIEPSTPQVLSGRTIASWVISPTASARQSDDLPVTILVQAQIAPRRADLRWQVTARCDALPGVAVPLAPIQLTEILVALGQAQTQTSVDLDSIRSVMRRPRLLPTAKQSLAQQRLALEEQRKTIDRAQELVAIAGLFSHMLSEKLKVHGQLLNSPGKGSTGAGKGDVLLQIGDYGISAADPLD